MDVHNLSFLVILSRNLRIESPVIETEFSKVSQNLYKKLELPFFNLCFFEFRENFLEYLLKILINYLEIEFINKKITPTTVHPTFRGLQYGWCI